MRYQDFNRLLESASLQQKMDFVDMFKKFLPVAMDKLELNGLPKFEFHNTLQTGTQPSFGMYSTGNKHLHVALANRHPIDILRTIAHELVHYRQDLDNEIDDNSGVTGSPQENQAHEIAGIIMRNFNKQYPEFLKSKPITD
jgi:hypothetical protein